MDKALIFAEFDSFYSRFRPLTPYGKAFRDSDRFFTSARDLESINDLTGLVMASLPARSHAVQKVRFHLAAIPAVPPSVPQAATAADIFVYKKFLSHVSAAFAAAPAPVRKAFGFRWRSAELLSLLSQGPAGDAFHVADSFDARLGPLRRRLDAAAARLKILRLERIRSIAAATGLDFSLCDFLVVPEREGAELSASGEVFAQPHDGSNLVLRPVMGTGYLAAAAEADALRKQELEIEAGVTAKLAAALRRQAALISLYAGQTAGLDLALARAALAEEFSLKRPRFGKPGRPLRVKRGRFLPLEERLRAAGLKYTPLTADFSRPASVIYGSNMGGKTVALKTIAFLQLCAQAGLYVPAAGFETSVFGSILFLGPGEIERAGGLSSFGLEMRDFMEARRALRRAPAMIFMDEFARTTNADEAAGLLSAVIRDLAAFSGARVFAATHFSGLDPGPGSAVLRMRGLDKAAFARFFSVKRKGGLEEKLRLINRFMRYELASGKAADKVRDAVRIAAMLGVPAEVLKNARSSTED